MLCGWIGGRSAGFPPNGGATRAAEAGKRTGFEIGERVDEPHGDTKGGKERWEPPALSETVGPNSTATWKRERRTVVKITYSFRTYINPFGPQHRLQGRDRHICRSSRIFLMLLSGSLQSNWKFGTHCPKTSFRILEQASRGGQNWARGNGKPMVDDLLPFG